MFPEYVFSILLLSDEKSVAEYKNSIQNKKMIDVFNFNSASDKELRHFKYKTVLFISTFISRQEFVQQVGASYVKLQPKLSLSFFPIFDFLYCG